MAIRPANYEASYIQSEGRSYDKCFVVTPYIKAVIDETFSTRPVKAERIIGNYGKIDI